MNKGWVPLVPALFLVGCAMFGTWRTIPPPGGCDQCHSVPISANWEVAFTPVALHDETGQEPWQQPTSVLPKQASPLERMKVTEERCFHCHKGPNKAHTEYRGRYHH
ncbi:MAG: cytochrome C [Desulfuromonadales bacterium]|nr:cytochrome C [Desulfuromonadales bacterium]